jgi:Putative Flp pilus-assembly TadE/G-like
MRSGQRLADERGSVLTLGIGLSIAALMVVTLSVNVTSVWVARHSLDSVADGCALAAAQAIDVQAIYQHGVTGRIPLDQSLARQDVSKYLAKANVRAQFTDFRVRSIRVTHSQVRVEVEALSPLPFGYLMGRMRPVIVSAASAVNITR